MWSSREAKTKFSEVMKLALEAPQYISNRGNVQVAMVNARDYDELVKKYEEATRVAKKLQAIEAVALVQEALEKDGGIDPKFEKVACRELPGFE